MMPSPSDSSRSLTSRPSTRGLTHLGLHRPWLQALLTLGLAQVLLGILVVTFSMVASSVTTTESIKRSCPSWAGFSLAFSGVVGIVSWKRPFTLVISFFSLLSVLCVMLSMAGSVLSCKNAQLARDFRHCSMEGKVCVCCPPVPLLRPCPESGQELKVAPNSTCDEARGALKNLLFSVCGLTICATIICTLSAIICCIQIFSLDLMHTQLAPDRSVSGPLGPLACTSSPPAPLLHTMLDLEEFVPPVPPPPYYPPEYTCSSETDAQSITYNGSMDSPVPLYPTDCPPSYEAVMGLRGDSQATLFDPQLHDGSCICERVASIVDVSMDSGSLVLSAIGDLPGGSSPSEDSCLLELQGSVRSVDYVLFRSIQRSRAGYCLSLDCGLRGPFEDSPLPRPPRAARSHSCSAPEAPPALGAPAAARSCHRLEAWPPWVAPCFPELRRRVPRAGRSAAAPPARAPARRFSDSSGSLTPPGHRPPGHPAPPPLLLPRSHSDPGLAASSNTADFRDLYTKVFEEEAASVSSVDTGLCSEACLFHLAHRPSPKLLRAHSAEKRRPVPTFQKVPLPSGPTPAHSLGDLKGSWPGRALVARFLQMSRKTPDAGGHGAHGQKQMPRSRWGRPGRESLHLRSCGDLSSGSSLRRLLSARRLERGTRPHSLSLNGGTRETGL
ncbi:protein FAM189B isoform X1 [Pipistrellus kuhlii]|uniref:Family with sequence similarity 189 member B n=1 Tax=Pipistrellus kuhlii TaxID=59472 RepID=A0A7J7UT87_PIPKU|nr:protein FAM189B isoform X1 [Pipistrellus kuhlii]KAF6316002.1 family with sequence similarity 189 member B [Pipistrellus kuhlii]